MHPSPILIAIPSREEREGLLRHRPRLLDPMPHVITGMGGYSTAHRLTHSIIRLRPRLIIHVGIAGSYDSNLPLREVVEVTSVRMADMGAEDDQGQQINYHSILPSLTAQTPPWKDGTLHQPEPWASPQITAVSELTVPFASGQLDTIDRRRQLGATIESMEGAAVFYTCLIEGQPFISLRAISNRVEQRDTSQWDIDGSLFALAEVLTRLIDEVA